MNIAVICFKNEDVYEGLAGLVEYSEGKEITLLVPILKPLPLFFESVIKVAKEFEKVKLKFFFVSAEGYDNYLKYGDDLVVTDSPVKEAIRNLTVEDEVGIYWDDSGPAHYVVHSVEDLAIDIWDIADGLIPLDTESFDMSMDSDEIHDELISTMGKFVDLLAAFVANTVMESLGQAVAEHLMMADEDLDKRDFNPFDDQE